MLASSLSRDFGFFYLRAPGLSGPETLDLGKLGVTESEQTGGLRHLLRVKGYGEGAQGIGWCLWKGNLL